MGHIFYIYARRLPLAETNKKVWSPFASTSLRFWNHLERMETTVLHTTTMALWSTNCIHRSPNVGGAPLVIPLIEIFQISGRITRKHFRYYVVSD